MEKKVTVDEDDHNKIEWRQLHLLSRYCRLWCFAAGIMFVE